MSENRKRIVLHVGVHKTGSTSIQSVCRRNSKLLRSEGVLYPGPELDPRLSKGTNHRAYFSALSGKFTNLKTMSGIEECREALDKAVDTLRTDDSLHTLLISHEAISRSAKSLDRSILEAWEKEFDVTAVLYVRPLREWVESMYMQTLWGRANRGGGMPSVSKMFVESPEDIMPSAIFDALQKALPSAKIEIRSFVERREKNDLVEDFIRTTIPTVEPKIDKLRGNKKHKNRTKLTCNTMLLREAMNGGAGPETRSAIKKAMIAERKDGKSEPPLAGRTYYFVTEEDFERLGEIDAAEAKRFPDLRLDTPISRKSGASFGLTREEYDEMIEWLKPQLSGGAYKEAAASYPSGKA